MVRRPSTERVHTRECASSAPGLPRPYSALKRRSHPIAAAVSISRLFGTAQHHQFDAHAVSAPCRLNVNGRPALQASGWVGAVAGTVGRTRRTPRDDCRVVDQPYVTETALEDIAASTLHVDVSLPHILEPLWTKDTLSAILWSHALANKTRDHSAVQMLAAKASFAHQRHCPVRHQHTVRCLEGGTRGRCCFRLLLLLLLLLLATRQVFGQLGKVCERARRRPRGHTCARRRGARGRVVVVVVRVRRSDVGGIVDA